MEAINAIYDGYTFKPLGPIPVQGQYEVVITFTKPIGKAIEHADFDKKAAILSLEGILAGHEIDVDKDREERIELRG